MELKSGSKRHAPVVLACLFVASTSAVMANSSKSLLDPYSQFQAPQTTPGAKGSKPTPAPAPIDPSAEPETNTVMVNVGDEKPAAKSGKFTKLLHGGDDGKPSNGNSGDGGGMLSGVNDKFKSAGSGLVNGTKGAGAKMVSGSKVVGDSIANGAKASGNFFMKGAKAIGHGFKVTGEKMKDGTQAVGGKVASLPMPKLGGKKADKSNFPTTNSASRAQADDSDLAAKPSRALPQEAQVLTQAKPVKNVAAKPGFMSKFGKLKFFGKDDGPPVDEDGRKLSSDPLQDIPR